MSKPSQAIATLPTAVQAALVQLGDHLSTARLRRAESLRDWAVRLIEEGLRHLANPASDAQALAQELRVLKRPKRSVNGR